LINRISTLMEMRVARAVLDLETLWHRLQNEGKHEELKARFPTTSLAIETARVAIRAMYEPDDSMLKAYMGALEQPANEHKEPWHKAKMRKRWRAMIDAASPP
jgi:hypothetical protein